MNKAFTAVYLAAALSFGAGILRDWQLVQHVAQYPAVFGAMYCVALAASFSVNAVTLGRHWGHHPARLAVFVTASVALFVLLVLLWQPMDSALFWWMLPVPALYVVGALHARRLLDGGHVLVARLRDGVASLLAAGLITWGMGAEAFPIGVVLGTLLIMLAAWRLLASEPRAGSQIPAAAAPAMGDYVRTIFYANTASLLVNAWALWANNQAGTVFGLDAPIAVRVAVYGFQILSLPSVLVPGWAARRTLSGPLHWVAWACIALALLAALLPLTYSLVLLPLCALAALYASVLHLNTARTGY